MSLQYVTLVLDVADGQGNPALTGVASFTPSSWLTDSSDRMIITQDPVPCVFQPPNGYPQVKLLATDNAGALPAGWTWGVTFAGVPGNPPAFNFFLPFASGSTQYLSQQAPVAAGPSYAAYMPLPSGTPAAGAVPAATGLGEASVWSSVPVTEPALGMVIQLVSWDSSVSTYPAQPGVFHLAAATGGNLILQLPPSGAVPYGGNLAIKRIDSSGHTVTCQPASGEFVNGLSAGVVLSQQGQGRWFHPNTTAVGTAAGKGWVSY